MKSQKAGIETVNYNGFDYIVHPAFETNTSIGGWNEDLSGIWVGKYESAKDTATDSNSSDSGGSGTNIKIVPNVTSWRKISVGDCYTNALNYDKDKGSHLMKNSEWGAVAYLTHSQYGRNGNEVNINDSSDYITGSGKGSEDKNLSSSTGNEYGVFDLSGGAFEYVAVYNEGTTDSHGKSLIEETEQQYVTKYKTSSSVTNYGSYYPGDATYEVFTGSGQDAWFNNKSFLMNQTFPFFKRGGSCSGIDGAGMFYADFANGWIMGDGSFRVILAGI